jgi:hypothetical protein
MDPDTAADVMSVVFSAAVQAGMDPNVASYSVTFGEDGSAAVKAQSAEGVAFDGQVPADEIAKALGMAPAEGADEAAPGGPEGNQAAPQ